MIEYICKECEVTELLYEIVPKKECPHCGKYLEAIEHQDK